MSTEVDHADVVATREGVTLIAEAKGRTSSPGLDVDTLYGQLLRRMGALSGDTRYALVVPEHLCRAVARVAEPVRDRLGIEVFLVSPDGKVARFREAPDELGRSS